MAGPGVAWLAARTGKDPAELLGSPGVAVAAALRELAALAGQVESGDRTICGRVEAELALLREEITAAPPPSEAFLATVARALRDAAEQLTIDDG